MNHTDAKTYGVPGFGLITVKQTGIHHHRYLVGNQSASGSRLWRLVIFICISTYISVFCFGDATS